MASARSRARLRPLTSPGARSSPSTAIPDRGRTPHHDGGPPMKRLIGVAAVIAVLVMGAVSPAAAVCPNLDPCQGACPILIQFDANAFAHETNYNTATFVSTPGSQLNIVGLITQFGGGLSGLDANDPNKEYTFRLTGLTSQGTVIGANGPTALYDASYDTLTAATFEIHEGTPRNSPD